MYIESLDETTNVGPQAVDDFMRFGAHSLIVAVMLEIVMISECGNLLFMVFGGAPPTLIGCLETQNSNHSFTEADLCKLYHANDCTPIIEHQFYSINIEFDLLCEGASKVKDSTSYQMIGYLIGSMLWGQISDVYGRKKPMITTLLLNGIVGIASTFAPNLFIFTILRIAVSLSFTGHIVISMVYFCEIFPSKQRLWLAFILNWSPNLIIVAGIAWICGDWRIFSFVVNMLCFVAAGIMWFCVESPHYLLRRQRIDEAVEVVKHIYEIDKAELNEKALQKIFNRERRKQSFIPQEQFSFPHLVCTSKLAGYTWAVFLSYFSSSIINYALLFNMESMSGSIYANTFLMGLFRLIINIGSAFADAKFQWLGRKTAHKFFCMYTCTIICIALIGNIWDVGNVPTLIISYLLLSAASMICQMYAVVSVVCNEVFPTPIRNLAYAMTQFSESTATIVAPQLYLLSLYASWLPLLVMLLLVLGDFVSFHFCIPETKGKALADLMPIGEDRVGIFRKKSNISQVYSNDIEKY